MSFLAALAILAVASASPLLPAPWSAISLAATVGLWFLMRPGRDRAWVIAVPLGAAGLILLAQFLFAQGIEAGRWRGSVPARFEAFVEQFEHDAERVRTRLGDATEDRPRLEVFDELVRAARDGGAGNAYFVVDRDGFAVAWAGERLLHDPEGMPLPAQGPGFIASYSAISVYAVEPLSSGTRPWKVIVGQSYPRDRLPFAPAFGVSSAGLGWSLEADREAIATAGGLCLSLDGGQGSPVSQPWLAWPWAAVVIGLAFLAAALREVRIRSMGGEGGRDSDLFLIAYGFLGAASLLSAFGMSLEAAAVLLAAALFVTANYLVATDGIGGWLLGFRYGLGVAVALGISLFYQSTRGSLDLGTHLAVNAEGFAVRLSLVAIVVSALFGRSAVRRSGSRAWLVPSYLLVLGAGILHDTPMLALPLLLAAIVPAVDWVPRLQATLTTGGSLVLLVFGALTAATAWETSYRIVLKEELGASMDEQLKLPGREELGKWKIEMEGFLQSDEAQVLASRAVSRSELKDLAVSLWRRSPLPNLEAISALVVDVLGQDASSFSYGVPFAGDGLDAEAVAELLPLSTRRGLLWLEGSVGLEKDGQKWAEAFFWAVPLRPIESRTSNRQDLEIALLGGSLSTPRARLQSDPSVNVYGLDGSLIRSSWRTARGVSPAELEIERGIASTPEGPAWFWSQREGPAFFRLFLPRLVAFGGLERVGVHALAVLLLVGATMLVVLLLSLPRTEFRALLLDWISSYSKRLIVVFTVLVLLPLLVLNLVLFRTMGERLEIEHRQAGEVTLRFAERGLSDYLQTLPEGFAARTAIEDGLRSLSEAVEGELNIYWVGEFFASTKLELFNAGLLPGRIPGEIYSALVLRGASQASRTSRVGNLSYLEIYAPLAMEERSVASGDAPLILSTPLLAQEQKITAQLEKLAQQSLLVTASIFLLLLAAGASLAKSFTRPLMEIVEGTDRIAGGASALGLQPREPELLSLVRAIDDMAARIAAGRQELLREKRVVEEVVDNIAAGVTSLNAEGRVLMRNRVAAQLLGIEVGEPLSSLSDRADLKPVTRFLARAQGESLQETVRLGSGEGDEKEWSLVWVPVAGAGEPSALFVVEDATDILQSQRLQAWAEMARMIAHEVKNPLTPIRLSTEHLRRVYLEDREHLDEIFERCTENILVQVEELRQISSEFSTYSHNPSMDLQEGDLGELVESIAQAYSSASSSGVGVSLSSPEELLVARFDARLLGRAIRNLIENAVRANANEGEVDLSVGRENGEAQIQVDDQGPGVPADLLGRIFEPYFSTHDSGTGLGLPIAKRIVEEHGGAIVAHNRTEGGLSVRIRLPLPPAST